MSDKELAVTPAWPTAGQELSLQWDALRESMRQLQAAAKSLVVDFNATDSSLSALKFIEFGDQTVVRRFRIGFDGTQSLVLQRNTGTDATPSWSSFLTFDSVSQAINFVSSTLTVGTITATTANLTTVNSTNVGGINPAAHASRHLPGGADPITIGGPATDVASTNDEGVQNLLARSDHAHRGVSQLSADHSTAIYGVISLLSGNRTTITKTSNDLKVSWTSPGQNQIANTQDQVVNTTVETNITGCTGLTFSPVPNNTNIYRVRGIVQVNNGTSSANTVTVNLYCGPTGTISDSTNGAKVLVVQKTVGGSQVDSLVFPPFRYTPTTTFVAVGLTVTYGIANAANKVLGSNAITSFIGYEEVPQGS